MFGSKQIALWCWRGLLIENITNIAQQRWKINDNVKIMHAKH